MKSASQLSLEIRRKKKAMQDNPGVVDLSGIPMDKTDEDIMDQENLTTAMGLDHNKPKERSAHMELMADSRSPKHEEMAPDPQLDDTKMKRKERLSKAMRK